MQDIPVMDCGDGRVRAQTGVQRAPVAKTAAYTVLHSDAGTTFTNSGASGAVTFTLPLSDLTVNPPRRITGMRFRFVKYANQNLTLAVGTGAKINNGTATTGVYANTTSSASSWPLTDVEAISETEWAVFPGVGTWANA